MKENLNEQGDPLNYSKKLTFDSNLDTNANLEYINRWNDNFIRDPDFDDEKKIYKKPMDNIIVADLTNLKEQIYNGKYKKDKDKYGVISKNFMSNLMYIRLYFMDCENILWEILNANKNFTNVNNESIAEVDLSNQLNETQNSRMKKLMETNFGNRLIKDSNYDASDVEDCYFEYAKSKYADRYFFYFSRLRKLSEYTFHSVNKEYKKYNVENIKKVKAEMEQNKANIEKLQRQRRKQEEEADQASNNTSSEISQLKNQNDQESINQLKKLNNNLIAKKQLVTDTNQKITELQTQNLELQKILDHPLTKFYKEHKDEIETVKKEIGDIKEGWKRQYQKFIFAYLLEHPEQISNLEKIIEKHWTSETAIDFSEFLIKQTNHKNFSYACLEFDNLLNSRNSSFDAPSRQAKLDLYEKYENEIKSLDQNKRILINSLLCENDSKKTLKYKFVGKATCIFYWCLKIAFLISIGPILLCAPLTILALLSLLFSWISFSLGLSLCSDDALVRLFRFCLFNEYCGPLSFITIYPSTAFLTILYISLAVLAIATIFLVYKKIQYYYFEKSLKHPPEDKDLDKKLNQDISKESDIYSSINHEPLISDLDSSEKVSSNAKNK
ncbi:MAG: hypothetical protein IJU86_04205 [Firmicutes bacterium]|nr:hypothetical protein [Bacillota bacterium]